MILMILVSIIILIICFPSMVVEDNPCKSTNSSRVVGQVNDEPMKTCKYNEAIRPMSMVMSGPYYFSLYFVVNDHVTTETLSQYSFLVYFLHGSHFVCSFFMNYLHQSFDNNDIFCDKIEAFVEGYYLIRFTMNNNSVIFGMVNRGLLDLILSICHMLLIQDLLLISYERVIAGLELHDWLE